MTTRWRPEFFPEHLYFLTTTAAGHAHVFRREIIKRILVDSLHYTCLLNNAELYAFVVMPNHVHLILQFSPERPPKDWARGFKTTTAQLIVREYQVEGNHKALAALSGSVERPDRQSYKVWEDGYHAENVATAEFLRQKLTYLHSNPVQPHWLLAESPEAYAWSSARFYGSGAPALVPVKDARELMG